MLCQFWNTLVEYFGGINSHPPPIFRSTLPLYITHRLKVKIFQPPPPPLFNMLKSPYPPTGQGRGGTQTIQQGGQYFNPLARSLFSTQLNICYAAFCENSQQLKTVNYFSKKSSIVMFDQVLNTPL